MRLQMPNNIKEFYNKFSYPVFGDHTLSDMIDTGARDRSDPSIHWNKFWPQKSKDEKLEILVAGCGTYQAAIVAARNSNCHVTGIDVSDNSIKIQNNVIEKEGINNVELKVCAITDYVTDKKFDLIICSGVLHHLENPNDNLAHLAGLLNNDGVMTIMIYNYFGRQGVYNIQALVKLLNIPQDIAGAQQLTKIIDGLPQEHSVNNYIKNNQEVLYFENFMDTFFNPHDVCYTALDIPRLIENTGLKFHDWLEMNYDEEIEYNLDPFERAFYLDSVKEQNSILSFILKKET